MGPKSAKAHDYGIGGWHLGHAIIRARMVSLIFLCTIPIGLTAAPVIPVIAAPQLPAMEKVGGVTTVPRNPLLPLMGAGSPIHTAGEGFMAEVPLARPAPAPPAGTPQKPKAGAGGPGGPAVSDGYLRVEVHAKSGNFRLSE